MREKYIEEMVREVIGPRGGSEEIIKGADPYTEYITGVIVPKSCKQYELNPDSEILDIEGDDTEVGEIDSRDTVVSTHPTELDPRERSKSFGISFLINGDKPNLKVCVTWGRYSKEKIESKNCDDGDVVKPEFLWRRKPYKKILNLIITDESSDEIIIYEGEDGKIRLNNRRLKKVGNSFHVILSLINELKIGECYGDEVIKSSLYQPSIRVIVGNDCKLESIESAKNDELNFIYRENPVLARGHMCSAIWKDVDYQNEFDVQVLWPDGVYFDECHEFIECDVRSEFIPLYPNPAPLFEWIDSGTSEIPVLSATRLSEMWREAEIEEYLAPISKSYEKWIIKNEASLKGLSDKNKSIANNIIIQQKICLKRINEGIECLKNDENILLSFCFANKVIWLQNFWKKGGKLGINNIDFVWRPFQIAFILMNLESLSSENSKYRDYLDLLWVPTGGGKTEAYLAMMAFIISLRRRRARVGPQNEGRDITGAGISVITRYTLRLLTVQQFRRTLSMITAAEFLRVFNNNGSVGWRPEKCSILDDWLFGSARFSAGMWVGGGVSPNNLRGEYGAIKALSEGVTDGEPAQIIKCPVCGSWLAIPSSGISEGTNTLHLVVNSKRSLSDLSNDIIALKLCSEPIINLEFSNKGCLQNHFILSITLKSTKKIDEKYFDDLVLEVEKHIGIKVISFRPSRSGYFPSYNEAGRRQESPVDFEIFCPNPECDLNNHLIHKEGIPLNVFPGMHEHFPDGLFARKITVPFVCGTHIPIPAYTVDEQIYHRCPSVIISTADKIARLAFEPRASAIFGNVKKYNAFYGFYHEDLFPKDITKKAKDPKYSIDINIFGPPDMIVQDELHLMDGPLGSMFGLYECVVKGLIMDYGGRPKYIASSATVNEAEKQVDKLFHRPLSQFPPNGLSFKDSFFVKIPSWSSGWDENRPGRVYMGVHTPGRGSLTPIIRIWSRLLKTGEDNRYDKSILNFWTLVGYFNSIRELGGNRALFREDIIERLGSISERNVRNVDAEKVVELSSRINSTDIPQLLDELEGGKYKSIDENPDSIFTTSMFGTGVDIPHLSLMVVNGQPKTTSQYIQATGRVGRDHGALVVTFYKAGRVRDLSHYEIFTGYHHRINIEVEPASVAPFSDGCLQKAAGSSLVSFLRNMSLPSCNWSGESGHVIQSPLSKHDFKKFIEVCIPKDVKSNVISYFESQYDNWLNISSVLGKNQTLSYNEYTLHTPPNKNVVLGDPAHERDQTLKTIYKNAPQSLREIEETTAFEV